MQNYPEGKKHCGNGINNHIMNEHVKSTGADPRFQEKWFVCIKVKGFALLILSNFS